jgi:hypothetical protein
MHPDPSPSPPTETGEGEDAPRLTWHDREVVAALRRLANARSEVAALEAQLALQDAAPSTEPQDAGTIERLQTEIDALARKAQSRFGGAAARERVAQLRGEQSMLLARLGFDTYEDFVAAGGLLAPSEQIDPVFLDFARRELAAAEVAWQEVLKLPEEAPEPQVYEGIDGVEVGDVTSVPDPSPPIDLTRPEGD